MKKTTIQMANHVVEVRHRYDLLERLSQKYMSAGQADLVMEITAEDMAAEKECSAGGASEESLEALAFYRKFSDLVSCEGTILFHGCVVVTGGEAYLFTAPSGTGKSTHAALWQELLGEKMQVLNGDKPLLRMENGQMMAYGTPFCGKEGWGYSGKAPLRGVCFLQRGEKNEIRCIGASEAFVPAYKQMYLPKKQENLAKALECLSNLLNTVPLWQLRCNISAEAAKLSYETMTGRTDDI